MSGRIERTGDGIAYSEFDATHPDPRRACPCGCGSRDLRREIVRGVVVTCLRCYTDSRDPPGWRIGGKAEAALAAAEHERRTTAAAQWASWLAVATGELTAKGDPADNNRREARAARGARRGGTL